MSNSYDELLRQVASLKTENSKLRQELQDNSSNLTKLENEACNMKNVLTRLHESCQDDLDLEPENTEMTRTLDQNCNDERHSDPGVVRIHPPPPPLVDNRMSNSVGHKSQSNSPAGTPSKRRSQDKEVYSYMDDLNRERNSILWDIEQENKHRKRYFDQLDVLTKKLENLPLTDEYDLQMDMSRRQLEYEAQRLQERMKSELGAAEQIQRRHDARLQRIRAIEQEMLRLQQKQRDQDQSERNRNSSGSTNDRGKMSDACTETEPLLPPSQEFNTDRNSIPTIYHGAWPIENEQMRHSVPGPYQETSSVMSFNSSTGSLGSRGGNNKPIHQQQQLGTKVEMVYSLLSMLGTHDKDDMSRTLLAMSSSQDSCIAMRQSGCLPLLIQLLHGNDKDSGLLGNTRGSKAARARAAAALHNIVHSHPDDKRGRREARVLRLLEQIRAHCDKLREPDSDEDEHEADGKRSRPGSTTSKSADFDHHPGPAIAALMKLSFDEEHRHAICTLGGLQAIAELLQVDTDSHGNTTEQYNVTMRRYACMGLTNLTFGDGTNKALLCSMKLCLRAIVLQLLSPNEDLCQVAASVLRNLSWRADLASKKMLREVDTVSVLTEAALAVKKESTLKSILSALWNLSAHCSENKADICAVNGALAFLVSTLTYKSPSKTLAIIENGGGILRNVSSHIAIREDYREILRDHNCLTLLLKHLRSPSLTIVSNACGTLWNLSARCAEDQQALWELGAVSMLRNLVHSKHKMISMGSAAALKNLLAAKPNITIDDKQKVGMPMLHVRKQKALEAELDQNLSETCENLESPQPSPVEVRKADTSRYQYNGETSGMYSVGDTERHPRHMMRPLLYRNTHSGDSSPVTENRCRQPVRSVSRSGSQDSVGSVHSDISHDRTRVNSMLARSSKLLQSASFERRRDGSYQRYGEVDRKPSRIERMMQEVAMHAGIENSPSASPGSGDSSFKNAKPNHSNNDNKNLSVEKYSNLHEKMENLNLNDNIEGDEKPLNYSTKYMSADSPVSNAQTGWLPNSNVNSRPVAKVGNYVGSPVNGPQNYGISPHGSPMMQRSFERKECNIKNMNTGNTVPKFSGYRETDIDTMDERPTNFSLQYNEADEPSSGIEEPINYSVRYREPSSSCADCKIEGRHTHPPHAYHDDHNDFCGGDTMKTFCTEGTPLNFMSTATSISDLSAKPNGSESRGEERLADVSEDTRADTGDEVKDYSTRFPESEKMSGSGSFQTGSTVISTTLNSEKNDTRLSKEGVTKPAPLNQVDQKAAPVSSGPMYSYNDSSINSPHDKPITFGVEGTPTCFSRVSSLSSLNMNDAEEPSEQKPVTQQSHERSYTPPGVPGLKSPPADVGYERDQNKTVTFDEHVQETPLMFSRCSSLESLGSCEQHSIHSSIPSEYSTRRTSEVVSPSDLPDSPSETMPPSPKRKEAPVKFNDHTPTSEIPVIPPVQRPVMPTATTHPMPANNHTVKPMVKPAELSAMFRETPVSYAVEDSPYNFSQASSLSALTIDDEPRIKKDLTLRSQVVSMPPKTDMSILEENSSLSEGDEDMLIECINSGMPASNKKKMKKSQSDNSIKKKSSSSQSKLNQIARGSRSSSRMSSKSGFGSAPTNFAPRPSGMATTPPRSLTSKIPSHPSSVPSRIAHISHAPQSRTPPPPAAPHQPSPAHRSHSLPRPISSSLPRPSSASRLNHSASASQIRRPNSTLARPYMNDDYAPDSVTKYSTTEPPRNQQPVFAQSPRATVESPRARQPTRPVPQSDDFAEDTVKTYSTPEAPSGQPLSRNTPRQPAQIRPNFYSNDDYMLDTVKTFATEGTPLNFSTATSLSDLSAIVDDNKIDTPKQDNKKPTPAASEAKTSDKDNVTSDTSSLSDGEDLLSEIIQSAMPKKVTTSKRQSAEGAEKKETKVTSPAVAPPSDRKPPASAVVNAWQFQPQRTSSAKCPSITQDTLKTYMTEGTPINFSTATSLSDLTVDDSCDVESKIIDPVSKPMSDLRMPCQPDTLQETQDDSVFIQSHSYDSPRVYAVEGTPYSASRRDSLSSLSCDEDDADVEKLKPLPKKSPPSMEFKPSAMSPPKGYSPTKKPEHQTVAQLAGHHRKRTESPEHTVTQSAEYIEQKNMDEQPKNFAVEGTPMCFSRNSSLSSLNSDDHEGMATSNLSNNERSHHEQKDQRAKEGMPNTFSRNSSLSSLSIISMESMSYDPSPTEQALLDQCISSAMPKKLIPPSKQAKGQVRKSTSADRGKGPMGQRKPQSQVLNQNFIKQESETDTRERKSIDALSPQRTTDGDVKKTQSLKLSPPNHLAKKGVKKEQVSPPGPSRTCSVAAAGAASVPTDNQIQQDSNGNSQLSVWRKAPHKSFDETRSKNVEGMGRFGWRRAHSQDSDAFVKQRKDSTNNAKIQEKLASPEEKLEWRKTYTVTAALPKKTESYVVDNRMLDQQLKSPDTEKGVMETGREKPPSPETERVNVVSASEDGTRSEASEVSEEMDSLLTIEDMTPRVIDDFDLMDSDSEVGDIMQETMPILSGFTSMETSVSSSMSRSVQSMSKSGELLDQPTQHGNVERNTTEQQEDGDELDLDMSFEDVQALEEAANMVVKTIKRDMSNCTLDEDLFINNETLSLVSTDYASDTCSEASMTWSCSSKTSEHTSDISSSSASVLRRGPRILKPGERTAAEVKNQEEAPKGIRGKRKPLYSVKPVAKPVVNKPKDTPTKTSPRAMVAKPVARPGVQKSVGSTPTSAVRKPVAKPATATAVVTPVKSPPRTAPKPVAKKPVGAASDNVKEAPSLGSRSNTVIRKSPVGKPTAVRPKPPTKQGTFVKDAPSSENAPTIDEDKNGNKATESINSVGNDTKTPGKASPPMKADKNNAELMKPGSNRTWTKALGGHGFTVELSQDVGKPESQMQQKKSASQIGSTGARRPGSASPRSANTKTTVPVQTKGSLNKTSSGSSLIKTSSGSSLNKSAGAGSRNALTKVSSAGNLKKTSSKTSLKQSDSNASLKKSGSRSSTPTGRDTPPSDAGRRSSTDSTPGKKNSTAGFVGKKQVNSKIAGLWKKDDGSPSPAGKPSPVAKKTPGSPNTPRRSATPTRLAKNAPRSGSPSSRPPPAPPLRKSSLSSNSSTSSLSGASSSKSSVSDGKKGAASSGIKKPETISRGRTFDKIARPATPDKNGSPGKMTPGKTTPNWRKEKTPAGRTATKGKSDVWQKRDSSSESLSRTADSVSIASTSSEVSLSLKSDQSSENISQSSEKNNEKSSAVCEKSSPGRTPMSKPVSGLRPVSKPATKPKPKPKQNTIPNGQLSVENNQGDVSKIARSPPLSPTNSARKPPQGDNRNNSEPLSAIVQPFNYNPNQVKNSKPDEVALKNAVNSANTPDSPKPMTKTEMLLARRKQASKKSEDSLPGEDDEAKKAGCLVTTV